MESDFDQKLELTRLLILPTHLIMLSVTFFFFPLNGKKSKRFANVEEVKWKTMKALEGITLQESRDYFKQ